jgi:signal transduction histidine kinase
MVQSAYKRRNYFIDKAFQTNFIVKFSLVVILASMSIGGMVYSLFQDSTTVVIQNTKVLVKPTSDFILPGMVDILLFVTVVSALVVSVLSIITSHRISGPLFRLKKEIELVQQGIMGRSFNLRAKDQMQDLAKSLSEMSNVLKQKHTDMGQRYNKLKKFMEQNSDKLNDMQKQELNKILTEMEEVLNYFKLA